MWIVHGQNQILFVVTFSLIVYFTEFLHCPKANEVSELKKSIIWLKFEMTSCSTEKMKKISMCGHSLNVGKWLNTKTWGKLTNSLPKLKPNLIL